MKMHVTKFIKLVTTLPLNSYFRTGISSLTTLTKGFGFRNLKSGANFSSSPNDVHENTYVLPDTEAWNFLTNRDPARETKLRQVQLEYEINKDSGDEVPLKINLSEWAELLDIESTSQRKKYLNFLFLNEKKSENKLLKKKVKAQEREALKQETQKLIDEGVITYGLYLNSIFYYYSDARLNSGIFVPRLLSSMLNGPKIILDAGYSNIMTRRECKETAKQILMMQSCNREHRQPFHLCLHNLKEQDPIREYLKKLIPNVEHIGYPMDIFSDCYTNHYPLDKLVYLTPDAPTALKRFDEDRVYIIGGLVDKNPSLNSSFAKAKEQNIKVAKFPLDQYLSWGPSSTKSLALNHVLSILLDLRATNDWKLALKHVPSRKLKNRTHNNPYIVRNARHSGMWWDDPLPSQEKRKSGLKVKSLFQE